MKSLVSFAFVLSLTNSVYAQCNCPCSTPTPTLAPTPTPTSVPDFYTFQTDLDLIGSEPRLWAAQQAGYQFDNWTTPGLFYDRIHALELNSGVDWLLYCNIVATGCSASTAMTAHQWFNNGLSPVYKAYWRIIWYPRSSQAGVRLSLADDGWVNEVVLATTDTYLPNENTAHSLYFDITDGWNAAVGGPHKHLEMASKGNGQIGAIVYQSRITFIHRIAR